MVDQDEVIRLRSRLIERDEKYGRLSEDYDRLQEWCENLKSCIQTLIESFAGVSSERDEKIKFFILKETCGKVFRIESRVMLW